MTKTGKLLNSDWETISLDEVKDWVVQGADVKAKNRVGEMPVHLASAYGRTEIVKYLVMHGSDVMARDDDYQTPLHLASEYGYTKAVMYLVEQGADTKAKDDAGNTPLDLAKERGCTEVVKYLEKAEKTLSQQRPQNALLSLAMSAQLKEHSR